MDNWSVVGGQLSVVSGQLLVVGGQWSVVGGQLLYFLAYCLPVPYSNS